VHGLTVSSGRSKSIKSLTTFVPKVRHDLNRSVALHRYRNVVDAEVNLSSSRERATHEKPGSQAMILYSTGVVLTAILPSMPFKISCTASGSALSNSSGSKSTSGRSSP